MHKAAITMAMAVLGGMFWSGDLSSADKCAPHYAVVESGSDLDAFLDGFDSKFGTGETEDSLDRSKVTAAFGCQFKGNFPSDNACPSGTSLTRGTDTRYLCHSNHPIPEAARTCLEGFTKLQDYEHETSPAGKIGRYGFFCNAAEDDGQDGFNEKVCADSGASPIPNLVRFAPGTAFPMLGCVYNK